jgi:D-3-phosphoglycerate dehydrogenase
MEVSDPKPGLAGDVRVVAYPSGQLSQFLGEVGDAVVAGGGTVVSDPREANAAIWCSHLPDGLPELFEAAPGVRWVQLPFAGVEVFLPAMDTERVFTCAKGVYGPNAAEFALGLLLAGFRGIGRYARASHFERLPSRSLRGAEILILGAGGIGGCLASLLAPLGARVTVASRSGRQVEGATSIPVSELDSVLPQADAVVVAVPLTEETTAMVDAAFLARMKPTAWLVSVARGKCVVTDDLVEALTAGRLGGAALDVTEPEPLPEGHLLWSLDNVIITPHVANTADISKGLIMELIEENTRRAVRGEPLTGVVDVAAGY